MSHGGNPVSRVLGAIAQAVVVALVFGAAFIIGCVLDFLNHPWEWFKDYWWFALLMLISFVGMVRDLSKSRRR